MKLHQIKWLDSRAGNGGWCRDTDDTEPVEVVSVGVIVKRNKRAITLTSSLADLGSSSKQYYSPITIPHCSIRRIKTIGRLKKKWGGA